MQTHEYMTDAAVRARCRPGQEDSYMEKLREHGFAILEPQPGERLDLDAIMTALGTPVEYKFGSKLSIEPQRGSTNSQFSNGAMALHTDAVLNAGSEVRFVGMECHVAPPSGGETLVASSAAFFAIAPPELVQTLRNVTIEYRSRVDGYYVEASDSSHPVASPIRVDPVTGGDALYLALDDPRDEHRNYSAGVVGFGERDSANLLREVDDLLRRPEVLYAHEWRVGEIILLDNGRVLHGRAPFPAGAARKLVRLSVA